MDVVQERNSPRAGDLGNAVRATVTRAGNIGGVLSRSVPYGGDTAAGVNGVMYFAYDDRGNVTTLTNNQGTVVGSYTYNAWGNTTSRLAYDNAGAPLGLGGSRTLDNPYRYPTKEAMAGMSFFGFRFYDAGNGRWINRDPLGEDGGLNLYAAMGNGPVNQSDDYGLQPQPAPFIVPIPPTAPAVNTYQAAAG